MVTITPRLPDRPLGNPLTCAGSSFAENFYGLKRRRKPLIETERARAALGGVPEEEHLGPKELRRSLLFLVGYHDFLKSPEGTYEFQVGIPYLRAKAKDYYEELGGGIDPEVMEDITDVRRIQALTDQARIILCLLSDFFPIDQYIVCDG
jgi:hypothetical protein